MQSLHALCYLTFRITENVLNGRSASGRATIPYKIPIGLPEPQRHLPAILLARIMQGVNFILDEPEQTALAVKLLQYIARSERSVSDVVWTFDVASLQRAINSRPAIITSRAGIAAMLRFAAQQEQQQTKQLARDAVKPRRLLWSSGSYTLTEMTDPTHLREDGFAVGHCSGNHYDTGYESSLPEIPTGRERLYALTYWRQMAHGHMRIFTLHEATTPVATMAYAVHTHRLCELEVAGHVFVAEHPLLRPLCEAITYLRNLMPITSIANLPGSPRAGHALATDGTFIPIVPENAHRLIQANVRLTATNSAQDVATFATNPYLTLDLTHASEDAIAALTHAAGNLRATRRQLRFENLETLGGNLLVALPSRIITPKLVSVGGSLMMHGAAMVSQAKLEHIGGDNHCTGVDYVYQPKLTRVGGENYVENCRKVVQPSIPRTPAPFFSVPRLILPPPRRI